MAYQVIARRYRPSTFKEVIGQSHITETIAGSIAKLSAAHAYLFSGPHGVGKTSLARIIAKALNCVDGPTDTPCGKCDSCRQIVEGNSLDVIEIDGASNRGIDSIRGIIENARVSPASSRYKVYIIDEVHQITSEAFNALLKTLEEPPKHVVFILATTEIDKVLPTIKSRCQQFVFKRLTIEDVERLLAHILEKEGVEYEKDALFLIARYSRGSVRDSETILEKMIAYTSGKGKITASAVVEVLGSNSFSMIVDFLNAIVNSDTKAFFEITRSMKENGTDVKSFMQSIIEYMRVCIMLGVGITDVKIIEVSESERDELMTFVRKFNAEETRLILDYILETDYRVRMANNPFLIFEMRCIKLLDVNSLKAPTVIQEVSSAVKQESSPTKNVIYPNQTQADASDKKVQFYNKILSVTEKLSPRVYSYLSQGRPVGKEGSTLIIGLPKGTLALLTEDKRSMGIVTDSIKQVTPNPNVKFSFVALEDYSQSTSSDMGSRIEEVLGAKRVDEEE